METIRHTLAGTALRVSAKITLSGVQDNVGGVMHLVKIGKRKHTTRIVGKLCLLEILDMACTASASRISILRGKEECLLFPHEGLPNIPHEERGIGKLKLRNHFYYLFNQHGPEF